MAAWSWGAAELLDGREGDGEVAEGILSWSGVGGLDVAHDFGR